MREESGVREQGREREGRGDWSERAKTVGEREEGQSVGMREEIKSGCERGEIVRGRERVVEKEVRE